MSIAAHRFHNELRRRPESALEHIHLTPDYGLGPVRRLLGGVIGLDPCTTALNPTGAARFFTPPADGAASRWSAATIYCNPPYGQARIAGYGAAPRPAARDRRSCC